MMREVEKALALIAERIQEPRLRMFGLDRDLAMIGAALAQVKASIELLAAAQLAKHYGQAELPQELFDPLRHLGEKTLNAATAAHDLAQLRARHDEG